MSDNYKNNQDKTKWGKRVTLPPKANPIAYQTLLYHEVEAYRCLGCSAYSICLDFANQERWESFTCVLCPHYEDGGIEPSIPTGSFMHEPEEPV
jgi:hypothetical protein